MTPAQPHASLIQAKLPQWLIHESATTRQAMRRTGAPSLPWFEHALSHQPQTVQALRSAYAQHRFDTAQLNEMLDHLPTVEAFAEPLLKAALRERFKLELDVRQTYLFHAARATVDSSFESASADPTISAQQALKGATSSLLTAALQNFEAADAQPQGMDGNGRQAALFAAYPIIGVSVSGEPLSIPPHAFATLCRELDLGGRYQAQINNALHAIARPGDAPASVKANSAARFKLFERSAFELHTHLAYLKKDIDQDTHRTLLELAASQNAQECHFLSLFDVPLNGIVAIINDRGVTIYIPEDPHAPLRSYRNASEFAAALRLRLAKPDYQAFFARFVPASQRNQVFSLLHKQLFPLTWNNTQGLYEEQFDPQANLRIKTVAFDAPFLTALYQQKVSALKNDALFHAVPTAVQNQKAHDEKVQYTLGLFYEALNVAAFVVPVLGELMLAVTAIELCHTAYEGFASLSRGDRDAAFGFFMDVADNVAMLALLGAAGGAATGSLPAVEAPAAVASMKPVTLADGSSRLWQPDLAPFHHDVQLPATLKPDAQGLYHHQGKTWLPLDGRTYRVKPPEGQQPWRLAHPERPNSYEPPLRGNGKGAWLHELDVPGEWQGITLFHRLGHSVKDIGEVTAQRLMRISDTHEAVLRHTLAHGEAPPALLEDTLQRFRLDETLQRLARQLQDNAPDIDAASLIDLLTLEPGWPAERKLKLLDDQGQVVREWGSADSPSPMAPVPLHPGEDVLTTLLTHLSPIETRALFGDEASASRLDVPRRREIARQQLADSARLRRDSVFASRYQTLQDTPGGLPQLIRNAFHTLPTLVAEELVAQASAEELRMMREQATLPPRIVEEARAYLRKIRLLRAYEGVFLDSVHNPDSEKVKLHSIAALPGWSDQVHISVRQDGFGGQRLDSTGAEQSPIRKVLVKQGPDYETRDEDDGQLHGKDDVYGSILHALPDPQRAKLGFPHVGQKAELQVAVRNAPLLPRRKVEALLQTRPHEPGERSPMGLAEGRRGMPATGSGRIVLEDSLLDKLRILELEASFQADAQQLLSRLEASGLSREAIDARLNQLLDEQQALQASLDQWTLATAAAPALDTTRQLSRQRISDALWQHWRAHSLPELGQRPDPLRLHGITVQDFPAQLPDFISARVTRLTLSDFEPMPTYGAENRPLPEILADRTAQIEVMENFFSRFPQVTELQLTGSNAPGMNGRHPWTQLVRQHFPRLTVLNLVDMSMLIQTPQMADLRALTHLRRLDLSGNFMIGTPDFAGLTLDYLGLDRTVYDTRHATLPLFEDTLLDHVAHISLRGNRLTDLPVQVLANPPTLGPVTRIDVRDNPLSRATNIDALMSERTGSRYRFTVDLPDAEQTTLTHQRDELARALEDWSQASGSSSAADTQRETLRWQTEQLLLNYWRSAHINNSAPTLDLEGDLSEFPLTLPDFFYQRVDRLALSNPVSTPQQLDRLLRRFPRLESLTLYGHSTPLTRLPAALRDMQNLHYLDLTSQGMTIDQALLDDLAHLRNLRGLALDKNSIGSVTDGSVLLRTALNSLSLESVGLHTWPAWLDALLPRPLEALNLEGNQLRAVPDYLLANPRSRDHVTHINLRGNPLPEELMQSLQVSESYASSYTFDMDLEDLELESSSLGDSDSSARSHSPHGAPPPDEPALVDPWLTSGNVEQQAARRQVWQRLEEAGSYSDLLGLIDHQRGTADYRTGASRAALTERVWAVLEAADQDTALGQLLDATAQAPLQQLRDRETCPDGIRLAFNQIEIQVFTQRAVSESPGLGRGQQLQRLSRRLYRLDELDRQAILNTGSRDEAEVRLAYRMRLAVTLDLPLPPSRMLYEMVANVSQKELDTALAAVQQGEHGQAYLRHAAQQTFWVTYLRETYAERFKVLKDEYEANVLALDDRYPEETQEQLGARIVVLEQQWRENERALLMELTRIEERSADA